MLDKGTDLSDEKIYQLKREIARLNPTREQIQQMHDRFLRNHNYGDFALSRFLDGALPLYTYAQMEKFVTVKIEEMLKQATKATLDQYQKDVALSNCRQYLFQQELKQELQTRFLHKLEQRKEQERQHLSARLAQARRWLLVAPPHLIRDAFRMNIDSFKPGSRWTVKQLRNGWGLFIGEKIAPEKSFVDKDAAVEECTQRQQLDIDAFPDERLTANAEYFVEPLFDAVEKLMRQLPG